MKSLNSRFSANLTIGINACWFRSLLNYISLGYRIFVVDTTSLSRLITIAYIGVGSMTKVIEAIYENGVLKPVEKLNLKDGQRVKIMIVEKDFIQVARKIRAHLREKLKGKDLIKELIHERERFG